MKRIIPLLLLTLAVPVSGETTVKKPASSSKSDGTKEAGSNVTAGSSSQPSSSKPKTDDVKEGPQTEGPPVAAVSSIDPEDIQGFEHYAPQIQELIRKCLGLTKLNLTYSFGSADPKNGGMDCSGTIYFVLHDFGFKGVPRQSNEMAEWVEDKTLLYRVDSADSLSHAEFSSLQPGNLLFWSGTYDAGPRKTPVTHVMLYLGKLKSSGKHIVFGASDGRAYQGKRRSGVSVFDFSLPKSASTAKFYGYGMIPGVGKIDPPKPEPKPVPPQVVASQPLTPTKAQSAEVKKTVKVASVAPTETVKKKEPPPQTETMAKPRTVPVIVVAEAGPKPETSLAVTKPMEEVRPAIRVESDASDPPGVAKENKPVQVASSSSKSLDQSSVNSVKNTSAIKKPTSSSSSQKSKPVVKRKPAPPPPTPMERAQRAAKNFFENVKRSFP